MGKRDPGTVKVHVNPGNLTLKHARVGMVVIALFLLFGIIFGFIVVKNMPDSEKGLKFLTGGFFLIWIVVCISIMNIFARVQSKQKNPLVKSLVSFDAEEPFSPAESKKGDFSIRLRQLEQLKVDGLITEEEYQNKRKQILGEEW